MAKEYIERKLILKFIEDGLNNPDKSKAFGHDAIEIMTEVQYAPAADVVEVPKTGIGDLSDGYHTFNELYHHRAVLFAAMCNTYPHLAWKSKKHDTGDMFEWMFIVGIETPEGQATYHYDVDPYWDMFHVKELNRAPVWDGHTPDEAIRRISTIDPTPQWIPVTERLPEREKDVLVYDADNDEMHVWAFFCDADGDGWVDAAGDMRPWLDATHWMPLPEQPKDGGAENATD